nr:hypothetical protein [Acetobacter persici]
MAVSGATGVAIAPLRIGRDFGEQQSISALNFFRGAQLAQRGLPSDASRKLALLSCCVSGTTIQQLSKGYSIPLFDRIPQSATIAKQQADALGSTIGCFLLEFCQGGSNTDTDYATYYPLLAQYFEDAKAAIKSEFGQTIDPFIEIVPISGMNLPSTGLWMSAVRRWITFWPRRVPISRPWAIRPSTTARTTPAMVSGMWARCVPRSVIGSSRRGWRGNP